jgi:hypothetical protein
MSTEEVHTLSPPASVPIHSAKPPRASFFRSPAWIFLLVAVAVRAWLTIHTHGIIEGDEALLGLQAEQILRGSHPIYFWAQPYMGTLEAHLVALLFWIAGPSAWILRLEPVLLSLLLVWLTWKLANALADLARLPDYARSWFVTFAMCVAAIPPLYDLVIELRTYGGYIETFILMLWLLLSALRLTQRWHEASTREVVLRWTGIGLLVGLGLWVYPLIIMAILAAVLWIVGYIVIELVRVARQRDTRNTLGTILKGLCLGLAAIPAVLVGFAPGIYWGLHNNWANIRYLVSNSNGLAGSRLATIQHVTALYTSCTVPRIVGGALPTDGGVTATNPQLLTPGLIVGGACLLITVAAVGLSLFVRAMPLAQVQRMVGLPLVFAGCSAVIFCISSISTNILVYGCGKQDLVGRYATPLLLVLPFLFSAATLIVMLLVERRKQETNATVVSQPATAKRRIPPILSICLLTGLLVYAGVQGYSYLRSDPNYTTQTSGCTIAPANNAPVIAYMQREHIQYAWASGWVGNPITFATNGALVVIDPRWALNPASNRIPAYTTAILHAVRPSILLLAPHDDPRPALLQRFAQERIIYTVARFPSEPGVDLLVITPLNRTVAPSNGNDLGAGFGGC